MRFHHRRDRLPSLAVLAMLGFAFVLYGLVTLPQAHAGNPAIANNANCSVAAQSTNTCSWTLTVANVGDIIAVAVSVQDGISNVANPCTVVCIASITDTAVDIYSQQIGNSVIAGGVTCKLGLCMGAFIWSSTALVAGADTITVTANGVGANLTLFAMGAFDMTNLASGALATAAGSCNAAGTCLSGTAMQTGGSVTYGSATIEIAAVMQGAGGPPTAGTGYTIQYSANGGAGGEYSLTAASPNNFPMVKSVGGGSTYWALVGAVFGIAGVTTTTTSTTINTGCLGACGPDKNATKTYFSVGMPRLFIYDQSQNTVTPSQIDNVTVKVGTVKINTNTGLLKVLVYMPATPTLPASAGNLWTLVPGTGTNLVTIVNGSSTFFVHVNPQAIICASCYYAVGIMSNTNASRGGGSVGSGVTFFDTSQVGMPQYSYNPPSTTPPATFYTLAARTPYLWLYIHTTFTVATFTVTNTTTITQGATATSTVTTTSTMTSLDVAQSIKYTSNDAILLLVILVPAMALMIPLGIYTKSPFAAGIGFVAGLMIGTAAAAQAQMVQPVFLAITVLVSIFLIVGLLVMGRGGGG